MTLEEMGAPKKGQASAGRANPAGIPFLYLAENLDTCVAEVRPSNSQIIHIARFRPKKELKILDLTNPRASFSAAIFEEDQIVNTLKMVQLLEKLSGELSKPVIPSQSIIEYIPTQFLCEFIKTKGRFDGIKFKSSFGVGDNLVIFSEDSLEKRSIEKYTVISTSHQVEPEAPEAETHLSRS